MLRLERKPIPENYKHEKNIVAIAFHILHIA